MGAQSVACSPHRRSIQLVDAGNEDDDDDVAGDGERRANRPRLHDSEPVPTAALAGKPSLNHSLPSFLFQQRENINI